MKKHLQKGLSVFLIMALCLFMLTISYTDVAFASSYSEQLQEALQEKAELESALKSAKDKVNALQNSKKNVQTKVNELTSELTTISGKIYEMELKLADLDKQIETAKAELEEAKKQEAEQYASMKLRIQYMYENESSSIMNVMFGSKDMASMLNAMNYISELSEYDRLVMDKLTELREYRASVEEQLEKDYEEVKAAKASVEDQKAAVNVLLSAKNKELSQIGEEITDAKSVQSFYEQEVKAQAEVLAFITKQIAAENGKNYQNFMSAAGFLWPCPAYTRVSSDYGKRVAPISGATTNHQGVDLASPYGSDILAAQSGTVIKASYTSIMGNYIILNHGTDSSGNVICTIYEHASSLCVKEGDVVYQGQVIAKVGSTGNSTGNHLHFAVTKGGAYTSPWNYVTKP